MFAVIDHVFRAYLVAQGLRVYAGTCVFVRFTTSVFVL
jgi:hypothetical protein